ncbi:hypothetical protein ACSBR1_018024 [Camellia fascicularis]
MLKFKDRVWVLNVPDIKRRIMEKAYTSKFSLYPGNTKMYQDVKQNFWWPSSSQGICRCITVSRHSPPISYLLFADDYFVFMSFKMEEIWCLEWMLMAFSNQTRLRINFNKSELYVSHNMQPVHKRFLVSVLGVQIVEKPGIYLGANLGFSSKSRKENFSCLLEKIDRMVFAGRVGRSYVYRSGGAARALRLLQYPNSLFAQVMLGKYCVGQNFLRVPQRCSWEWRSILWGRDLLLLGLLWVVGNGKLINPFEDQWIPSLTNPLMG